MNFPMVSIVVPIYKAAVTISRCLDSIILQSYTQIEVILVIDGNYDDSYGICQKYKQKDSRLKVILKENGGISSARNRGLREASGKYIMFCDADDTMERNMVEKMVYSIEQSNSRMAICARKEIGFNEKVIRLKRHGLISREECQIHTIEDHNFMGVVWNKIFDRSLLHDIWFDEDISFCEDTLFVLKCLDKRDVGKVYCVDEPLYCYYVNNSNSITGNRKGLFDENDRLKYCVTLDRILSKINLDNRAQKAVHAVKFRLSVCYYCSMNKTYNKKQGELLLKDIKENRKYYLLYSHDSLKNKIYMLMRYLVFKTNMDKIVSCARFFCSTQTNKALDYWRQVKREKTQEYECMKKWENRFKGERCFVVATGPSLTIEDVNLLKREHVFTMNSMVYKLKEMDFKPEFYVIQDGMAYEILREKIVKSDLPNVFVGTGKYSMMRKEFLEDRNENGLWNIFPLNISYHMFTLNKTKIYPSKFSDKCNVVVYDGSTVAYSVLQLAVFMGFKTIYLLGTDCDYSGPVKRFADYEVTVAANEQLNSWRMIQAYKTARKYAEKHDVKIINVSRGGKLEVFERKTLEEVL